MRRIVVAGILGTVLLSASGATGAGNRPVLGVTGNVARFITYADLKVT